MHIYEAFTIILVLTEGLAAGHTHTKLNLTKISLPKHAVSTEIMVKVPLKRILW